MTTKTQRTIDLAKAVGAIPLLQDGITAFTASQLERFYLAAAADGKHHVVDGDKARSLDPRVEDLVLLVRRLASVVEIRAPGHQVTASAMEYLRENGFPDTALLAAAQKNNAA